MPGDIVLQTIENALTCTSVDSDSEYCRCVRELKYMGTREVLDEMQRLSISENSRERELAADVLAELGMPERTFPTESSKILTAMLTSEQEEDVLAAVLYALGHQKSSECIGSIIALLQQRPSSDISFAAVQALSRLDDNDASAQLILLMDNEDSDVRDWATFGIGSLTEMDSPDIRAALWRRVSDSNIDIRLEAIVGLAERRDERIRPILLDELRRENPYSLIVEAAGSFGDKTLLPELRRLNSNENSSTKFKNDVAFSIELLSDGNA